MTKKEICINNKSVAYYSGFFGLEIKHIEYGIDDYVYYVIGAWNGNPTYHKAKIYYAENGVFYLGYRNSGVDGNAFVKCRLTENKYYEYIRLYRLEISVDGEYITAELKRVSGYDARKELCDD